MRVRVPLDRRRYQRHCNRLDRSVARLRHRRRGGDGGAGGCHGAGDMTGGHGEDGAVGIQTNEAGGVLPGDVRQSPPLFSFVLPDKPTRGARLVIDGRPALAASNEDLPVLVYSRLV